MNYRAVLCIIVVSTVVKFFGFYLIFAIFSCFVVALLTFLLVLLSSSSDQSLKVVLRNPLEQQAKVKLGLNCKKLFLNNAK